MVIVVDVDSSVDITECSIINRNVLCTKPIPDSFLFQFDEGTEFYSEQWSYASNGDEISILSQRELDANVPYQGRCLVELMQYTRTRKSISQCVYVDEIGECHPCLVDISRDFNLLRVFVCINGSVIPYHKYYQMLSKDLADDNEFATSLFHNRMVGKVVIIVSICTLLALTFGQLFSYLIPIIFN